MRRKFWTWARCLLVIALAIPVLFGLYLAASEAAFYFQRSPRRAEQAARKVFLEVCIREHLDPKSFTGPYKPKSPVDQQRNEYTFIWSKTPEESIYVHVSYLPYDIVYSMSAALVEDKDRLAQHY